MSPASSPDTDGRHAQGEGGPAGDRPPHSGGQSTPRQKNSSPCIPSGSTWVQTYPDILHHPGLSGSRILGKDVGLGPHSQPSPSLLILKSGVVHSKIK